MRRIIAACAVGIMGITGIAVATASPAEAAPTCVLIHLSLQLPGAPTPIELLCI
jgi:hypothetical protein